MIPHVGTGTVSGLRMKVKAMDKVWMAVEGEKGRLGEMMAESGRKLEAARSWDGEEGREEIGHLTGQLRALLAVSERRGRGPRDTGGLTRSAGGGHHT